MNRQSISALRRVGIAAGVAARAAAGGGVAAGATVSDTAAAKAPAAVAACATSQLQLWYGQPASGTAGSVYFPLEFSNTGSTSCVLDGYPGVSGVGDGGVQLGSSATWNPVITPSNVVLTPGSTAHVILRVTDVGNYPASTCEPTQAVPLFRQLRSGHSGEESQGLCGLVAAEEGARVVQQPRLDLRGRGRGGLHVR